MVCMNIASTSPHLQGRWNEIENEIQGGVRKAVRSILMLDESGVMCGYSIFSPPSTQTEQLLKCNSRKPEPEEW